MSMVKKGSGKAEGHQEGPRTVVCDRRVDVARHDARHGTRRAAERVTMKYETERSKEERRNKRQKRELHPTG